MARVVILGAGISGHTAALHFRRSLGKNHEVVMVTPKLKMELDSFKHLGRCWKDERRAGDIPVSANLQAQRN